MFITAQEVESRTGAPVSPVTVQIAQDQIEVHVGRFEHEVTNYHDRLLLAKATLFQAVYLEQKALQQRQPQVIRTEDEGTEGESGNTDSPSPPAPLSPWAERACAKVSWVTTRSIKTKPLFEKDTKNNEWFTD